MNELEELLTRELGAAAGDVDGVRTDLGGMQRVGGRERRRRRVLAGAGVAAAAAVVALVATLATVLPSGSDGVDPAGDGDRPAGALRLTWSEGDTVHLPSGRTVDVDGLGRVVASGPTALVEAGGLWSVVRDTPDTEDLRAVPLTANALGTPALSLGGDSIAWVDQGAGAFVVTSYDVATAAVTTTTLDPGRGGASLVGVGGVDDVGRVVVERRSRPQLLVTPGEGTVEVTLPDPVEGAALLPGGKALLVGGRTDLGERTDLLGVLGSDGVGRTTRELVPTTVVDAFNLDASAYAATSPDGSVRLVRLDDPDGTAEPDGAPVLALPAGDDPWEPAGWEDVDHVVLSNGAELQRCSLSTSTCAPVPGGMRQLAAPL